MRGTFHQFTGTNVSAFSIFSHKSPLCSLFLSNFFSYIFYFIDNQYFMKNVKNVNFLKFNSFALLKVLLQGILSYFS